VIGGARAFRVRLDRAALDAFTFDRLLATLLFLTIALAAALMPAQNDTFWQMRAGREIWASGRVLLRDTFSHTVYGARWPNHEWLSQALLYALYALGGLPIVTLTCAAIVVLAWRIVWNETPAAPRVKFLLISPIVVAACTIWSPRPQIFSLLLIPVTMRLLRARRYEWLPAIFLIWANLHGAVVMGAWVLVAALAASLVESPQSSRRLFAACAASALATCLTPLGVRFWIDVVASLRRIRAMRIAEWAPPRLGDPALIAFWLALGLLVFLAALRGRALWRDAEARARGHLTLCAAALALAPLAVSAVRNVPPFLMVAVPAIAALLPPLPQLSRRREPERPALNAAIAAVAATIAIGTVAIAYTLRVDRLGWAPLPAASIAKLNECRGNMYNRYDEGGYLIWFAPDRKVFLDGRQDPYPPSLIAEQVQAETTGDVDALLRRYDVGCAFTPSSSLVTARLVAEGWATLYRDARWSVLEKDPYAVGRPFQGRQRGEAESLALHNQSPIPIPTCRDSGVGHAVGRPFQGRRRGEAESLALQNKTTRG